jgi:hypothetical protein
MTMRSVRLVTVLVASGVLHAQPSSEQVLTEIGLSAAQKQHVLDGEFVTSKVDAVSERDVSFVVTFLVKASPDALSNQIVEGCIVTNDVQVQAYGMIDEPGSPAAFSGLRITADEARALTSAEPGDAVNRSAAEQASFTALRGATTQAVQDQLQHMLLARYRSYRASGLAGIAPYARNGGAVAEIAPDLTKAVQSATALQKHVPALYAALLDYPRAMPPGIRQSFLWLKSVVRDKPTYVLVHVLAAGDGEARAVVRREFYVSTGYNAEQSIAGLLPVAGGTVVLSMSHAFTDQVAGSGGTMKRSIGSRVMAAQMQEIFEKGRKRIER